ncbi:MAG: hypothetical protein RMJ98_06170 [Myxococcales bacterium]|nr:hypothetical protein [Myxococcales bacterium]
MTEPEQPVARNAILISLGLSAGIGMLALRHVLQEPLPQPGLAVASVAPTPMPTRLPELRPHAPATSPRRLPLDLTEEQRRAGYNECMVPDPGPGYFAAPRYLWKGMLYPPAQGGMREDGGYDVIVHFHGGPSARKALVGYARGVVLAGFDLGNGSASYAQPFASSMLFDELRHGIEKHLRAHSNRSDAYIRHLALSAWSAGYGAVNSILRHAGPAVADAVILLDGFHAGYLEGQGGHRIDEQNVAPLLEFARLAVEGQRFFYLTHSQVGTDDYASTTEMSEWLLRKLGIRRVAGGLSEDPLGLLTYADRGGFRLRGFGGNDRLAHCDHLRHLSEAVVLLEARWGTPPACPY